MLPYGRMNARYVWAGLCRFAIPLALVFALAGPALAQTSVAEKESALRVRASEFYEFYRNSMFEQSEEYVLPEGRAIFRSVPHDPILSHEIKKIVIASNGQDADVSVLFYVIAKVAPGPVPLAQVTKWRLMDGKWYLVVQRAPADPIKGVRRADLPEPPVHLKFQQKEIDLGSIAPGATGTAKFAFTNVSNQTVTVREVLLGPCECLTYAFDKKQYKPTESGELTVKLDRKDLIQNFAQGIVMRTDPGDGWQEVQVKAYIIPDLEKMEKDRGKKKN